MMSAFRISSHLNTLRRLCIEFLCFWLSVFVLCYSFHEFLLKMILKPFLNYLPNDNHIVLNQVLSPLTIPIEISMDFSLLLTLPFALIQLWRFVSPGLYVKEQRIAQILLTLGSILFILGGYFCWRLICPFIFSLLAHQKLEGMLWLPSFHSIYTFISTTLLFFGLAFQLPLILLLLGQLKLIEVKQIQALRPYAIVAAFIIGMLITPPDVGSQIIVALPLCFLFELGFVLLRIIDFLEKKKRRPLLQF